MMVVKLALAFILAINMQEVVAQPDVTGRRIERAVGDWSELGIGFGTPEDRWSCVDYLVTDQQTLEKYFKYILDEYEINIKRASVEQEQHVDTILRELDGAGIVLPFASRVGTMVCIADSITTTDHPDGIPSVSHDAMVIISVGAAWAEINWEDASSRQEALSYFVTELARKIGEAVYNKKSNLQLEWKDLYDRGFSVQQDGGDKLAKRRAFVSSLAVKNIHSDFSETIAFCILEPRTAIWTVEYGKDIGVHPLLVEKIDTAMDILSSIIFLEGDQHTSIREFLLAEGDIEEIQKRYNENSK